MPLDSSPDEKQALEQGIAALQAQRQSLGSAVVDVCVAVLRQHLAARHEAVHQAGQQRKQVTVLFADISGYTAMSESMDAEDVNALMNQLWKRLDETIITHGGWIDKHIGDAVMALWGVDTAREDDPERAVKAALAMQQELAVFHPANEQEIPSTSTLKMRVGLHTGQVLLGEVGTTAEYTAIGDTVNTASRLQHAAPVGGVLVSHATYQHVRGLFDIQPQDPIQVKGKTEPIQVYVILRPRPHAFRMGTRGLEGVSTPMVGRQAELDQLLTALQTARQQQVSQVITILGEAGLGKSRLQAEFETRIEQQAQPLQVFRGRSSPDMANRPYALLRDIFTSHLQIQESDALDIVWNKFEVGIATMFHSTSSDAQMQAHMIGALLGFDFRASPHLKSLLDDARQLRDRSLIYLTTFFKAAAQASPLLIILDDIHWADDSSLDALAYLFRALTSQSILFICLARPVLLERRPNWCRSAEQTLLKLQPLSPTDGQQLVKEILQHATELSPSLYELILRSAEGNPYYIEELVKMLIDEGAIIPHQAHWQVASEHLQTLRIPSTLTGILQARLDSLPGQERLTLQRSAVVGRTFWDLAISALSTSEQIALGDILKSLGQHELIFPHPTSTFAGTHEYAFKHTILHDVTYESVLKRDRRRYHASIAQWLITKSGPRKDEVSGLIADHLEKAGQAAQAIPYLRQAGEQARQTFANAEAVAYFTRALALLPSNDAQARCELLLSREQVYDLQGERSAQNQDLHALEQLAQDLPHAQQAQVCLRHANLAYVTSDYAASTAAAQHALQLAEQAQASQIKADAYLKLGQSCWRLAQYAEAQQNLAQALRLAQISGASQVEADALRNMGSLAYDQGNYPVAEEYFNRSLTLCQQISDRRSQSSVLNSLGILHRALGAISKSMDCYQRSLLLAREIGDRRMECATLINLGVLYRNQAEYAQAINQYEQALLILHEIDDPQYESAALSNLAVIWNLQGALDKTIQYYQRVLTIKRRIGDLRGESVALIGLATVYINAGLLEQAREFITQALQLKRQTLDRRGELIALTNHSRLSRLQNATAEAVQVAQQALSIAQELGDRSLIGYAYSELGTSLAAQGQHTEACTNLRKAITAWQEPGEQNLVFEAHAQIARSLLAQEQLLPALEEIEPTLSHIFAPQVPTDPIQWLMGATSSASVYMDCYIVLRAAQDNRAPLVLAAARQIIDAKAAMISDPALQCSFLETPTCRKIMSEEDSGA